jgi:hypothetical protein
MVVVGHEAVGMAEPAESLDRLGQGLEEGFLVHIVEEDFLAGIAAGGDVVHCARVLNP